MGNTTNVQIAGMASVYEAAEVTIVAAHGVDADSGIPGISKERTVPIRATTSRGTFLNGLRHTLLQMATTKCFTRAWTFKKCSCHTGA
jgi:hypothetical protein